MRLIHISILFLIVATLFSGCLEEPTDPADLSLYPDVKEIRNFTIFKVENGQLLLLDDRTHQIFAKDLDDFIPALYYKESNETKLQRVSYGWSGVAYILYAPKNSEFLLLKRKLR